MRIKLENGRTIEVEESFRDLPPEEQDRFVQEVMDEMSAASHKEFEDMPLYQKPFQAAGDVGTLAVKGAMDMAAGVGNIGGWMMGYDPQFTREGMVEAAGGDVDAHRRVVQGAQDRFGTGHQFAEAIPAMAGGGSSLIGQVVAGAAGSGATEAGQEGATPMDAGRGAVVGGLASGAGYGAGKVLSELAAPILQGAGKAVERYAPKVADLLGYERPVEALGRDALEAAGSKAFKEARASGALINPAAINRELKEFSQEIADGFDPALITPQAEKFLRELGEMRTQPQGIGELHTMQKKLKNAMPSTLENNGRYTRAILTKAIQRIDRMIDEANMLSTGADNAAATEAFRRGKDYWSRFRKVDELDDMVEAGSVHGATNVTDNQAQSIQKRISTIANPTHKRGKFGGYSDAEKRAAKNASGRSTLQQGLHIASGAAPDSKLTGILHGASAAGLAIQTGGMSLLPQAVGWGVGYLSKRASEALAKKSVEEFVDLVARGGVPQKTISNAWKRMPLNKQKEIEKLLGKAFLGGAITVQDEARPR